MPVRATLPAPPARQDGVDVDGVAADDDDDGDDDDDDEEPLELGASLLDDELEPSPPELSEDPDVLAGEAVRDDEPRLSVL
jgi:hypothetical protein